MCKRLTEWAPSESAIDIIKLNGINDKQIKKSLDYLREQKDLDDIADISGYDNWNAFFIMFCVKANAESD